MGDKGEQGWTEILGRGRERGGEGEGGRAGRLVHHRSKMEGSGALGREGGERRMGSA